MPDNAAPPTAIPSFKDTLRDLTQLHGSALRGLEELALQMSPTDYLQTIAAHFKLLPVTMHELHRMEPDFKTLPFVEASARLCVAFDQKDHLLFVAADPTDVRTRRWVDQRMRARPHLAYRWAIASVGDLRAYIASREKDVRAMDTVSMGMGNQEQRDSSTIAVSLAGISNDDSAVIRLLNSTIYDALKMQASDIHLESRATGLVIKCRVDGVLAVVGRVDDREVADQVLSRVKVISELNIAERRVPQDGRFKAKFSERDIDFRVSIMPNLFGEDAVLRILDRYQLSQSAGGLSLESLGFEASDSSFMRTLASMPYGMLLVTGPTGSGKTTTLYAVLSEINDGLDKVITIEDPVEYQLGDVLQIPVNEAKGLTFARGLRSILRHDPDRIMVGEIRDPETAQIAVQAALTGHQVFTTVHANNVFDVIGRFSNMDVDTYSFVSALNGIVAQRLVRKCCANCAEPVTPEIGLLAQSGLSAKQVEGYQFRQGRGCSVCRGTGYQGRKAIAERLRMTDELRELLATRAPISRVKAVAAEQGMKTLRASALGYVARGETTLEEINRVTMVD